MLVQFSRPSLTDGTDLGDDKIDFVRAPENKSSRCDGVYERRAERVSTGEVLQPYGRCKVKIERPRAFAPHGRFVSSCAATRSQNGKAKLPLIATAEKTDPLLLVCRVI